MRPDASLSTPRGAPGTAPLRAVIYTRVSTEEQARSGYSLRLQEERLRAHCHARGIEVVAHFQDDASAKTFNRPGFQEALAVIRRRDPAVNLLLFYRWDRFSRNAAQALAMIDEVQALGAEPNAVEEPVDYAQPHAILMQLVHLGVAQADNQMRSRRVREGMRRALREGRWVNRPPVGYRAERDGRRKPVLVPDERAPLVREAFELVAAGHLSCEEVRRRLVKRGLNIGRSKFTEMLKNVLYRGSSGCRRGGQSRKSSCKASTSRLWHRTSSTACSACSQDARDRVPESRRGSSRSFHSAATSPARRVAAR